MSRSVAEPRHAAVGHDGIEQHQPLDRTGQRHWAAEPVVWLADGRVERLVVQVKQPGATVAAGLRRRESARLQRLEERSPSGAPYLMPRERAVLAPQADTGVKHHGHQEPGLALGEPEAPDRGNPVARTSSASAAQARVGRLHTSSSARSGSNRLPRPVRPPARAPMPRNSVKPARTLPAHVGAAVVRREHLDVLDLAPAVRPEVLDLEVRKLDASVGVGELVILRPSANLVAVASGPAVAVGPAAVRLLEEQLVLALRSCSSITRSMCAPLLDQPLGGAQIGSIELRVVSQLALVAPSPS